MQRNKIIVIDGIDRSGKSITINKLIEEYKDTHNVVTLHTSDTQKHFKTYFKSITKEKLYDTIHASNIFSTYQNIVSLLELNKSHDKPLLILMGRFYVSAIVNGNILRPKNFEDKWDEYKEYAKAFELQIKELDVGYYYFIVSKDITSSKFEADNNNEYVSISEGTMYNLNRFYRYIHEYFNFESHIPIVLETETHNESYIKISKNIK